MAGKEIENSSMDQVRELLMGTHLKDMETRLKRQEKTILHEIANLRDTMQNRVDSLENFMKNEFSSFLRRLQEEKDERTSLLKNEHRERTEAIKSEQNEREQAFKRLDQDLAAKEKETERKFASISSSLDAAEKGLRELMLSENTRLTQTLEEKYQELMERIANTASQIRHDVVSRSNLSAMFAEAAVRFSEHEAEELSEYTEPESTQNTSPKTKGSNES